MIWEPLGSPRPFQWSTKSKYQNTFTIVLGRIMVPKWCHHFWQKGLCWCVSFICLIMNLEKTLFWIIYNHKGLYKRQNEAGLEQKRNQCDDRVEWCALHMEEGATSQGKQAAPQSRKGKGTDSPPLGTNPAKGLDFSLVRLMSDFWPPELQHNTFVLF